MTTAELLLLPLPASIGSIMLVEPISVFRIQSAWVQAEKEATSTVGRPEANSLADHRARTRAATAPPSEAAALVYRRRLLSSRSRRRRW